MVYKFFVAKFIYIYMYTRETEHQYTNLYTILTAKIKYIKLVPVAPLRKINKNN